MKGKHTHGWIGVAKRGLFNCVFHLLFNPVTGKVLLFPKTKK